jgi:hypothetical protein
MKTYLKNHSEKFFLIAVVAGLYIGTTCIGANWAVEVLQPPARALISIAPPPCNVQAYYDQKANSFTLDCDE